MPFRETAETPDKRTVRAREAAQQLPDTTSLQPRNPLSELDRKIIQLLAELPSEETPPTSIPQVKDLLHSISEHALSPPSHQLLEVDSNEWSATPESRQEGVYSYKVGSGRELILYPVEQFPNTFRAGKPFTSIFSSDQLLTNVFKLMCYVNKVPLKLQILKDYLIWLEGIGGM